MIKEYYKDVLGVVLIVSLTATFLSGYDMSEEEVAMGAPVGESGVSLRERVVR
jgi:hypothetical protein